MQEGGGGEGDGEWVQGLEECGGRRGLGEGGGVMVTAGVRWEGMEVRWERGGWGGGGDSLGHTLMSSLLTPCVPMPARPSSFRIIALETGEDFNYQRAFSALIKANDNPNVFHESRLFKGETQPRAKRGKNLGCKGLDVDISTVVRPRTAPHTATLPPYLV